jgi:SdrD B-like domain
MPQAGQTVSLYKDGVLYGTTYTSSTGSYSFTNLPNGIYSVSFTNGTSYTPAVANVGSLGGQANGLQTIMGIVLSGAVSSVSNNFGLMTTQLSFAGGGMGTSGHTPVDPTAPVVPVGPTQPTQPTAPVTSSPMIPLAPSVDNTALPPTSTDVEAPGQTPTVPCVLGNAWDMTCMPATGVDTDMIMNIIYSLGALLVLGFGISIVRRRLV